MNLPSVETLRKVAGDRALELRELLETKRHTRDYASVCDWERQCYCPPRYSERLMCAINEIVGGCGVEAICIEEDMHAGYEFVNVGDHYLETVIRDCGSGRVFVGDVATILERRL